MSWARARGGMRQGGRSSPADRAEVVEAIVPDVEFVRQDRQLGTGDAVMCA